MKGRAVSIYHTRIDNTYELLNRKAGEIFEACESEIQLERPDPKFRSSIIGAIGLACSIEHSRQAERRAKCSLLHRQRRLRNIRRSTNCSSKKSGNTRHLTCW